MRSLVYLLLAFCIPTLVMGQDLTGKWRGYFTPSNELEGKMVTYEIVIKENPDHSLTASTYSKISNNFTANALATGMHSENTNLVSITETRFDKKKLVGNFEACLMTNFLSYRMVRGYEILEGSYTATNEFSGKDCGGGKVYLEKEGPVVKDFITKSTSSQKENKTKPVKQIELVKQELTKTNQTNTSKFTNTSKLTNTKKLNPTTKSIITRKENATQVGSNQTPSNQTSSTQTIFTQTTTAPSNEVVNALPENTKAAAINETSASPNTSTTKSSGQVLAWVLVGRENKLVKQVIVNSPSISIDLYDNGTIDNDTIMIFDNKILLMENKRLSYKATHFDVNFNKDNNRHEIIIVAHNLGTVPPNT
ncbi:MAG: hypothetical protein WCQ10_07600, partial [Chitinophagia bacterium]